MPTVYDPRNLALISIVLAATVTYLWSPKTLNQISLYSVEGLPGNRRGPLGATNGLRQHGIPGRAGRRCHPNWVGLQLCRAAAIGKPSLDAARMIVVRAVVKLAKEM